jgi:hypothetical protein
VLTVGDGEVKNPADVIKEVKALGAGAGGEVGDDANLMEVAGAEGIAGMLVHLGVVEAVDDGSDSAR